MNSKKQLFLFLFVALLTNAFGQKNKETEAIKRVLERESATWRSGDIAGHADCWFIQPYSKIIISTGDTVIDVPPLLMINPTASMVGQGGSSFNTNYKISINGNHAWVSHNEESTAKDGKKTYSFEFRMLEKINRQWKIVAQSIHMNKQK